jgi:hypothetical protein
MGARQQRKKLEQELQRQRLPRAYVERLLAELDDHVVDLQDERQTDMKTAGKPETEAANKQLASVLNIDGLLGDPAQLAAFAEQQYRRRSFLGRHPIITFLIAPLPLVLAGIVAIAACFAVIDMVVGYLFPKFDPHDYTVTYIMTGALVFWLLVVVPPLTAAVFLCRIARRNAVNCRWTIAACVLVSLYCGLLFVSSSVVTMEDSHAKVSMGVGLMLLPPWTGIPWELLMWHFLPQFSLAMSIGLLLIKRAQRLRQIDQSHEEFVSLGQAA